MKVLAVEDDLITRRILGQMLTARGYEVILAESAEQAQEFLMKETFPFIVLDLHLPRMDGVAFTRWLRAQPWGERVYILVGTASMVAEGHGQTLEDILRAGANDYIAKPYNRRLFNIRLSVAEQQIHQIAQKYLLEQALQGEKDFISAIIENSAVLIVVLDTQGRIIRMNQPCLELTGLKTSETLYFPEVMIYSRDQPVIQEKLDLLRKQKGITQAEANVMNADGEKRYVSWKMTLIPEGAGQPEYIICSGLDITERRQAEEKLSYLAVRDPLTRCYNRNFLNDALPRFLTWAGEKESCMLLTLDLDNFKVVNDSVGHAAGDRLLFQVAELIRSSVRVADFVIRFGGDEFMVLLRDISLANAQKMAERLRKNLDGFSFVHAGQRFTISASLGLTKIHPLLSAEQVIAQADAACYAAKAKGRNRLVVFKEDDKGVRQIRTDTSWRERLKAALREDNFELWYEPVLVTRTGQLAFYEALLRYREPGGKAISPGEFFPTAERMKIMPEIDAYVIRNALLRLQADPKLQLSINLSGQSLEDPAHFQKFVIQEFRRAKVDPRRVIFELTESAVISNLKTTERMLHKLRRLGWRFALDDFGSGFSSYSYLRELPLDYLKIDGSFIAGLADDKINQALLRSIQTLARELKLKTVAEYVQSEKVLRLLKDLQVDFVQGYHLGKPQHVPFKAVGKKK